MGTTEVETKARSSDAEDIWEDVWNEGCPCGLNNAKLKDCCGPSLKGEAYPKTAELLMRARYSAFVLEEVDFIVETQDPASRDEIDRSEIEVWSKNSDWTGLSIVATEKGGENDTTGRVEFVAHYWIGEKEQRHHELSDFVKKDGKWYFSDGAMVNTTYQRSGPKVGRNDPCSCNSGKKFKKCCGKA